METFPIIVRILIICFASYFLLALNVIHLINMFKFYIPFSREMAENDIYSKVSHKQLIAGRWTSLIISTLVIGGAIVWLSVITLPVGPISVIASAALGVIRYRRHLGFTTTNITRFARSHSVYILDKEKFTAYIKKKYEKK